MGHADIIDESSKDDGADSDRRGAQRFMTILRVGKLVTGGAQELCLIRNISAGGLMAHVYAQHEIGDRVEIEFKSDERLSGEVVWVEEGRVGVRFEGEIEVSDILTHRTAPDGRKSRPPRIEVEGRARIKVGDVRHEVVVRDFSQGGIKVELDAPLKVGEDAVITVEGMHPVRGIVRWSRDGMAGLSFIKPIAFDELIRWLEAQGQA
ncbi:PilZ domain-containing protein [Sphingomonas cavernae]|uniref:PilZ domain-containing protein n=1 Tax=Sphingomonas cavernae TaxID=2320861 RepID=A0A418WK50_9SPHN|nr:PilZ domain-containing protein [Sphingomonas cavernae]RJF90414.1 PilZ domain-containing protein [Sphingomonas cavernae]